MANGYALLALTMLFEQHLHAEGTREYRYSIHRGSVGAADGVGFVFDTQIRRTNIQRMRSIFLNRQGQLCVRDHGNIIKLPGTLPRLVAGVVVDVEVDLVRGTIRFSVTDGSGVVTAVEAIHFAEHFAPAESPPRSGFFCAIVTGSIRVSLS